MKVIYQLFLFLTLTVLIIQSNAQVTIVPGWRQNVKNSLNSINKSNSLRIDKEGNCYVLGTTWFPDSAKNILLIKFNRVGEEQWRRIYDNDFNGDDLPLNMCLDNSGNIWVCGMAKTSDDNADFLVLKFNPDGIPVKDNLYDGKDHLFDCATSIAADNMGNVFAAGYETTVDSGINILLIKYSPDVNVIWKRTYATNQMDIVNQILTDDSSNVYICGISDNGPHSGDIIVQKYDPSGRLKWHFIYNGILGQGDAGQLISRDDSMNIYVSGFMNHVNSRSDIPLLKLNRNGKLLQDNHYNGQIADCGARSMNTYRNSIFVTAGCDDYNISYNTTFVLEYDKAGKEKKMVSAPKDVLFTKGIELNKRMLLLGNKTTHPESTLIPFISESDSTGIIWSFADSTVSGLSNITHTEIIGNDIYFLGDDAGDATGTISVFKYVVKEPEKGVEKKNTQEKKKK